MDLQTAELLSGRHWQVAKLGAFAVRAMIEGATGVMAGELGGEFTLTPLEQTWKNKKSLDEFLLEIMPALSQ